MIEQKALADKILNNLYVLDPYSIVAGGAPRDWYFGKPAVDIDVFFYGNTTLTVAEEKLKRLGYNVKSNDGSDLPEHYKLNPNLAAVFTAEVEHESVQFLMMNKPTFRSVVDEFPLSICKAWYKNGQSSFDKDFLRSVKHKAIVKTNKLYADENKYLQKILAKFPEYSYYQSWEELSKELLDRE